MNKILFGFALLLSSLAFAETDHAFRDPRYTHLIHPLVSKTTDKGIAKNDVAAVIANQSSVKAQGARGTCSIFSSTAYLESLINNNLNLSEEWLEYTALRLKGMEGSDAPTNFDAIRNYGMPNEQSYPYIAEDWTKVFNPLQETRCGHILDLKQKKSCLIVHNDPALLSLRLVNDREFSRAKEEAFLFRDQYLHFENTGYYRTSTNEIKRHLQKGSPIVLEMNFYLGAWNHREADDYGIGRNIDHWNKGIVFTAEPGSVDLVESNKHMSGHSVLVVGYDDTVILTKTIKMTDGSLKTFSHKGVYYFKNSWGTDGFGKDFQIDGVNYPGYGMIVQKHANEQGAFFTLPALK